MHNATDCELLRKYVEKGDEAAFAEVVRSHVDLVYSAALRLVGGDAQLAQDASQQVFTELARQARSLSRHATLVGWLHTTTRYVSSKAIRSERRRRTREQESFAMQNTPAMPEVNWEQLQPVLDEAVGSLPVDDRDVLLLRFFEGKSHRDIGTTIGVTEEAARKRIDRALEKLRGYFFRHGVTATSALLATAISANSVHAAPMGLAERTTETSLAGAGVAVDGIFLKILFMNVKNKMLLIGVILLAVATIWLFRVQEPLEPTIATNPKRPVVVTALIATPRSSIVTAPKVVESPAVPPVPKPAAELSPDPHAQSIGELNAALDNVAGFLREHELAQAYLALSPPDQVDLDYAQKLQKGVDDEKAAMTTVTNPAALQKVQEEHEVFAKVFEDFKHQVPTFNARGDEATYQYEDINGNTPLVFIKINGKWYRKDGGGKNGLRP